jgi:class 3 adenylate cyclase
VGERASVPLRIPHAETIEVSADIKHWYTGLTEPLKDFLPRAWADYQRLQSQPQRVLATVLFTDIVASTRKAVELGPRWQELLREHNAVVRRQIRKFSGREIDTAGDGFFASGFDGPARAIRCGCAIRDAIGNLGLGIRVGLHRRVRPRRRQTLRARRQHRRTRRRQSRTESCSSPAR